VSARGRTILGTILILASAPAMALMASQAEGLMVVVVGVIAYIVLGVGLWLAREWLGVTQAGPAARHGGCLSMVVTLLALLSAAGITYYVVFYGAWQVLSGSGK
jgi:hypothetical protein